MTLQIQDPESERLALALSQATGESVDVATRVALEERLRRVEALGRKAELLRELAESRARFRALPVLDARSADEILGYDASGLPG